MAHSSIPIVFLSIFPSPFLPPSLPSCLLSLPHPLSACQEECLLYATYLVATGLQRWMTCSSCLQGSHNRIALQWKSMFIIIKLHWIVATKSQFLLNNHEKIIRWHNNVIWLYFILFFATEQFSHSVSYKSPFHKWKLELNFHVSLMLS